MARIAGSDELIRRGPITVDASIVHTLRAALGKGPALNIGVREIAVPPEDLATASLIAGAIASMRQAV